MQLQDGDNVIWFGKYKDEKTWEEVLLEDPDYCEWVLSRRAERYLSLPGFAAFQRWLRKYKGRQRQLLYHYTDTASAKAILGSGVLKPSLKSAGDAHYGDGVYFTSLPQTTSYGTLHENNYDGSRKQRGQEAFVIVDRAKVPNLMQVDHPDRDIFVALRSDPLVLSTVRGRLSWKKGSREYLFY